MSTSVEKNALGNNAGCLEGNDSGATIALNAVDDSRKMISFNFQDYNHIRLVPLYVAGNTP